MAVEFRNRYWLASNNLEETFCFLRRDNLSFIAAVDEPQGFKASVPPMVDVTGEYGIVRFHGRNRETWEKKGQAFASERFNYYYGLEELEEWVPKIRFMKEQARELHLVMNTNFMNQGVVNARLMGGLLEEGSAS